MLRSLGFAAALLSVAAFAAPTPNEQYFFDTIPAAPDLKWYPCNETFYCARLSVPLNPFEPNNGLRNEIPLIKLPANDSCEYKGIVLTNPGGPGGLGIGFILTSGLQIQNFTGPGYDIIGFDPRGMGYSVPNGGIPNPLTQQPIEESRVNATYIPSGNYPQKRQSNDDNWGIEVPPRSPIWIEGVYNTSAQFNELLKTVSGENQALRYMTTPHVAFDMLEIAKADARSKGQCADDVLVNYYGVSYGSVLGQTFASIYPDHVGRFVIDSVVDLDAWYNGRLEDLSVVLEHADEGFHIFFQDCFNAGPELCSFYTGASPNDIRDRFNTIFSYFDVTLAETEGWANLTEITVGLETLKGIMQSIGYNSIATFPLWADTLVGVESLILAGNVTVESMGEISSLWLPPSDAASPDRPEYVFETWCSDCQNPILRGSHQPLPEDVVERTRKESVTTGERLLLIYGMCTGLDLEPNWVFNYTIGVKTKTPILFIGFSVDLVTPIQNAVKAAEIHEGAGFLSVEAVGHGILDKDNWCAFAKTRAYFQDGTLPGDDNHCPREAIPFINKPSSQVRAASEGATKRDLNSKRYPINEWRPRFPGF